MRSSSLAALLAAATTALPVAAQLPRFETKQALENIRFISRDGLQTYAQKRSGGLTLIANFRASELVAGEPGTNYLVTSSPARGKVVIEVERAWHQELDPTKLHDLLVAPLGATKTTPVGRGRDPRLQLGDEWLTWYDPKEKAIHVQFLPVRDRHYLIRLSRKHNPFFRPQVAMINPETVLYTDVNEQGFAALLSYNLLSNQLTVLRKAEQSGTRMEICRHDRYLALGEFSYDDANRGSAIHVMAWQGAPAVGGLATLYKSSDNDLGQMVCAADRVWFVKTVAEDRKWNNRLTEAASMEFPSGKIEVKTRMERVTQLIEVDGRVFIPFRGETFVLSGDTGSKQDRLPGPQGAQP